MQKDEKQTVSLAIVGLGKWGLDAARSLAALGKCRIAWLCDADQSKLDAATACFSGAASTTSFETMLRERGIDAVVVATPAPLHFEMTQRALLAGKHVLVEGPMSLLSAEAVELAELAWWRNRKLMVGHQSEFDPAVDLVKQYVDRGKLGTIRQIHCQHVDPGAARHGENAFWTVAPHDLAIILRLLGEEPQRVTAVGACTGQEGTEDLVIATLHFAGGPVAAIHASWNGPRKTQTITIVGSRKTIVLDAMNPTEKVRVYEQNVVHVPSLSEQSAIEAEAEHFIDCIVEDRTPRSDAETGLRVVRALEAVEHELHPTDVLHGRMPAEQFSDATHRTEMAATSR